MTTLPSSWEKRIAEVGSIDARVKALTERRNALGLAFAAALTDYEQVLADHDLGIEVPCGFRADPPDYRRHGKDTFWSFLRIDPVASEVVFIHDCERDHWTIQQDDVNLLRVPLMFFTHPDEWLLLTALAADPVSEETR